MMASTPVDRLSRYQGYSAEELARTTEISRGEDPKWRWVLPVTRSTREFIIEQMPSLYAAYGIAIGLILAAALVEGRHGAPLLVAWLLESAVSIALRALIQRRMEAVSPVQIALRPALRMLPLVGILLAAVHWVWTASIFIDTTLNTTTVVVLLTFVMLSVACIGIAPVSPVICVAYIVPMWSATAYQLFHADWTTAATLIVMASALAGVLWLAFYMVVGGVRRYLVRGDEIEVLIHELRQRNGEVEVLRDAAAKDLQTRTAIFASASHDLRQRVHALKLLAKCGDASLHPRLTGAVEDLELYMTDLLQFVQLGAAGPPSLTVVALQDVLQRVELTFEDVAAARGISLKVRASNVLLRTDCALLVRIIENLVSNAIKFSRRGVLVAARPKQHDLHIEVWDQGAGFDTRRFNQAHPLESPATSPTRTAGGGFGLGLVIVRRLTDTLGYAVDARSWPGCGTRMRIVVPAASFIKETDA